MNSHQFIPSLGHLCLSNHLSGIFPHTSIRISYFSSSSRCSITYSRLCNFVWKINILRLFFFLGMVSYKKKMAHFILVQNIYIISQFIVVQNIYIFSQFISFSKYSYSATIYSCSKYWITTSLYSNVFTISLFSLTIYFCSKYQIAISLYSLTIYSC